MIKSYFEQFLPKLTIGRSRHRAFTMAELVVVITIMGLITTMSITAFMSARRHGDVKAYAEKVKDAILSARSDAMSGSATTSTVTIDTTADTIVTNTTTLTFPSNIDLVSGTTFSFITTNPNKLGQINATTDPNICLANSDATPVRYKITVNRLTGNVESKSVASCP